MPYPNSPPVSYPNHFGQTSLSTGLSTVAFGFNAAAVKLVNDGAGPVYVRFDGVAASTGGAAYVLSTGDGPQEFRDLGTGIAGLSYSTTSTTNSLRIGAWG